MTTTTIEKGLLDVRKAYRLLHDYQRCAMDLARYISTRLGFFEGKGESMFSDRPTRGRINLTETWAWDWLGMYQYDFAFSQKNSSCKMSLLLISDTGFYLDQNRVPKETDITTFASPEDSHTKLGFLLFKRWPPKCDEMMGERDVLRNFINKNGALPRKLRDAGIVGKCCDFARCHDRKSTDEVIDELAALAELHKMPLRRIKKAA